MSTGLLALLDDVTAIAKVAAASLDDTVSQAARAGAKSAGVVIDDAAVTPRYVVGFAPARELPIIGKIALGSLKNKLLLLLPLALVLSFLAPWLITPLLMLGGAYLCLEGAEKVSSVLFSGAEHGKAKAAEIAAGNARALEDRQVKAAIRTDLVLSAEIMFIALATVPDLGIWSQAVVLAIVGLGITVAVYGAVAILVKADDVGLAMARLEATSRLGGLTRQLGRLIVAGMPAVLKTLTVVGTTAMLWVGGSILVHGLAHFGLAAPEHLIEAAAHAASVAAPGGTGIVQWIVTALGHGITGLAVGTLLVPLAHHVLEPLLTLAKGDVRALR